MKRLLLVISDPNVGVVLSEYLRLREYSVDYCSTPTEAYGAVTGTQYDLCVLGPDDREALLQLTADIRRASDVPVFALQPVFNKEEQVALYEAGADDCIVQPVVPDVLIAKMEAMSRRWNRFCSQLPTSFAYQDVQFDSVTQILNVGEHTYSLSTKENGVLLLLCRNANQLVERSRILKEVWLSDNYFNARSLSVYINKLKHFLEPDSQLRIVSMRMRGYKLLIP